MSFAAELAVVLSVMGMFDTGIDAEQLHCMATNVYHEARNEPIAGQVAVAQVVMNRVNHPRRWGDTVCDVVYEIRTRNGRNIPQFSWVGTGAKVNLDNVIELGAYERAIEISLMVMHSNIDHLNGVTHYYNPDKASPSWANKMELHASIGNHAFMEGN